MTSLLEIWYTAWIPLAGLALGIATILVSLVYMFGSALMNDKMKGWAKLELVEIFYSAVIIALIAAPGVGALSIADSAVQGGIGALPGPIWVAESGTSVDLCSDAVAADPASPYYNVEACHIRIGMWFMHSLFNEAKDMAYKIYLNYIYTSTAADFTINFEFIIEKAGFFTVTPWRGFFTTGNTIKSMVFDYLVKLMILAKFQEILLKFVATTLFPALFVVGVLLRTFTFSRRLGGLLLGIAVAMYYVYPAFYAFGGLVAYNLKVQVQASPDFANNCKGISKDACNDPPITNSLYMNGNVLVPGGDIPVDSALVDLQRYERMKPEDRARLIESDRGGSKPLGADPGNPSGKGADFGASVAANNAGAGVSLDQREKDMGTARNATQSWFLKVTNHSMFDQAIFVAYQPGGPVDALSRLAFFSTFFSLFGILATIAAIRSLSITFGGDIEIAGLTHLI